MCCMFQSLYIDMQHDHGLGSAGYFLLSYWCNCDSLKCDMQHDLVLKKLNFDLLK